jgi:hypothetical protein
MLAVRVPKQLQDGYAMPAPSKNNIRKQRVPIVLHKREVVP